MTIQQTILAYLFGTLPAQEKQDWERELIHNAAMKADIKALRKLFSERKVASEAEWEAICTQAKTDETLQKWVNEAENYIKKIAHRDFQLAFVEGKVSEQEQKAYEEEKKVNPELQQNEQDMKTLTELLQAAKHLNTARAAFKNANLPEIDWAEIEKEIGEKIPEKPATETKKIPIWKRPIFRMVAAAVFVVGIGLGILWFTQRNEEVYDNTHFVAYLETPSFISGQMGGNTTTLQELKTLCDAKKYTEVIQKIEANPNATNDYKTLLGFCYLQNKQFDKAISLLETLKNDEYVRADARLYLALGHILKGEDELARKELTELLQIPLDEDGGIKAKATKLLADLNSEKRKKN